MNNFKLIKKLSKQERELISRIINHTYHTYQGLEQLKDMKRKLNKTTRVLEKCHKKPRKINLRTSAKSADNQKETK